MIMACVRLFAFAAALLGIADSSFSQAQSRNVTVFAAASLKNALDAVADEFRHQTGKRVVISYAASPALARQIEQGAPADIFFSADLDWMEYLEHRNLIKSETRQNLLGNRIVLVAPATTPGEVALNPDALTAALGTGRLAIANVTAVPAGKYGKAALESLGLWKEVAGRLAETENVRAALTFVARGETPLGVVYDTDAKAEPNVKVVAEFPKTSHPAIIYPVALTASSRNADAAPFLEALRAPASAALFAREGFTILD
jgi:molybdate transport system substrate-binding protein